MSGTSLDGIDIAEINFKFSESRITYTLGVSETIPYPKKWEKSLSESISYTETQLKELNTLYTNYLSEVIDAFIKKNTIVSLDAICSHGHTILHQPEKGVTLQIGNLKALSENTKQTVVCDFRVQDVKLGGQGAPLVPIGDQLLFGEYEYCLNLGGFANLSRVMDKNRIAYDICPVNIVLNYYVQKMGLAYDDRGDIAATGIIDKELLGNLNNLNFYQDTPPKSLGLEWVKKFIFPLIDAKNIEIKDILRTFIEHIAIQISKQIKGGGTVLSTGGGVYNDFLLQRIEAHSENKISIPSKRLVEFKEALIFGLLGVLKLRGEVNCLASVTGASKDHSSGIIFN